MVSDLGTKRGAERVGRQRDNTNSFGMAISAGRCLVLKLAAILTSCLRKDYSHSCPIGIFGGKNPQAAADGPHMAKAAAACGVLRTG